MLHKTHERYHLRNLHRGAMLVYCGQCKIIDFSKFETVSNWKTVQNGVKKGSCTFVLYVCMWGRSKVHSTMWAGLINFALWQLTRSFFHIHIILNIIFKKSRKNSFTNKFSLSSTPHQTTFFVIPSKWGLFVCQITKQLWRRNKVPT